MLFIRIQSSPLTLAYQALRINFLHLPMTKVAQTKDQESKAKGRFRFTQNLSFSGQYEELTRQAKVQPLIGSLDVICS